MVLKRNERQVDAGEPADLASPLACGVHDDLGAHLAGRRLQQPATALAPDRHDRRPAVNAHVRRATDEGVRQPCRIDVAVRRQVRRGEDAARVEQRVQLSEPLRPDELERHADELRHRRPLSELLEPIVGRGQSDAPARVVVDRLPRLRLEPLVELDRVAQQPHQVVARVELGAESGCVPGRAGCQLSLLE